LYTVVSRRGGVIHLRRWRVAVVGLVLAVGFAAGAGGASAAPVPASGTVTAAASTPSIPLGSALWFACTEPFFDGPWSLACPVPYSPQYLQTFLAGFQRFTPENEFKMEYLEPEQGHFNFSVADQIAEFAQTYHKTIRGHTLLWFRQNPWWLIHPLVPWTRNSLLAVMKTYITTVVGHFANEFPGVVTEWDVVNEPLTPRGHVAWNPWEYYIGPDYIGLALEYAHAADPSAKLVINDLDNETPGAPKTDAELALATQLKESGAPLDAVGFESHVTPDTAPSYEQLVTLWDQYKAADLQVEVTELDVGNDNGVDDPAAKQAVFETYARACRVVGNCIGLTVWGVADQYSWLGPNTDALLYDTSFQATPAVGVVHQLLDGVLTEPKQQPKQQPKPKPKQQPKPRRSGRRYVRHRGHHHGGNHHRGHRRH
jgi:GH35 family endo-1,4-beta-xylanase